MGIDPSKIPQHLRGHIPLREGAVRREPTNPGRHKYGVAPIQDRRAQGITFASKLERVVFETLQTCGVDPIHLQPSFLLQEPYALYGKKNQAIHYIADFLLGPPRQSADEPLADNQLVIDAKGITPETFNIKRKLFEFGYQRSIILVRNARQARAVANRWLSCLDGKEVDQWYRQDGNKIQ